MENNKNPRRSVSLGSYRTEDMNKIMTNTKKHTDLLVYYIDYIRNYKVLTEDMLENIKGFDDSSKMTLIYEYNIVIKAVNGLLG